MTTIALFLLSGILAVTPAADSDQPFERNWWQWRGPLGSGIAPKGNPPLEWGEGKNVRWKVEVPGHGLSTPIVWDNLVFIQTAVTIKSPAAEDADKSEPSPARGDGRRGGRGDGERGERTERPGRGEGPGRGMRREAPTDLVQFKVMAYDRATGKLVWERKVREEIPHEGSHQDGGLACNSPITDGRHIYAYFGSRGLYALTMKGELVWEKDLGRMRTRNGFGEGSSPALHEDTLIINWDHEGDSFIVALDKNTGKERWRKERDEVTSWSTPYVLVDQGRPQVVVSASHRVRSYDLKTGDVIWEAGGLGTNCTPTPVVGHGLLFTMSGHRDPALLAIRHQGARGDLTGSDAIAWKLDKGTPYVPSPLLYGDTLFFLQRNTGILSCHDPRTGEPHFDQQRLEEIPGVYASLVGARDRVYVLGRNGVTYVLKRDPSFEVLATNKLDDEFSASPAIVDDELLLRGHKHLYCIAAP